MMEQKLIILATIIYFAFVTSSVLKFLFKGSLKIFYFGFSFLMPIFILMLLIGFNRYIFKSDFKGGPFFKKCFYIVEIALVELKSLPIIHTEVIDILCQCKKRSNENPFNLNFASLVELPTKVHSQIHKLFTAVELEIPIAEKIFPFFSELYDAENEYLVTKKATR